MRKKRLAGVVMITTMTALIGISPVATAANKKKQTINVAITEEMATPDISLADASSSFAAINNFEEGLYRVNAEQKVEPAGASKIAAASSDGLTYLIDLRKGAKWSNGEPVTAHDYVYSWQRTVDPKNAAEYAYLFACIKNGSQIAAGKIDKSQLGIEATNDYQLKITLASATPYFNYLMAFTSFFPQNQKFVESQGSKYGQTSENMLYNGPFVLTNFSGGGSDDSWVYQKNETYWDKENVKLNAVNIDVVKEDSTALNLFKDGEADDVTLTGELAQQNKTNKHFISGKVSRTNYLEFNQRKKKSPFNNQKLRLAFANAIDRQALVNQILGDGSLQSTGLIPSGLAQNTTTGVDFTKDSGNHLAYNVKKAKRYWQQAKRELGIKKLDFTLLCDDTDSAKKVAEYLQNTYEENFAGMTVTIKSVPFPVRMARSNSGDFDVVLSGWVADYSDLSSFMDCFVTGTTYNRGRWSNERYDQLVTAARSTDVENPAKRWSDYLAAEKILLKDAAVVPIYQKAEAHLRQSAVKNIVYHSAGAAWDYKWAYVK
jgi:oligopeptide transport system substrate-binding protein